MSDGTSGARLTGSDVERKAIEVIAERGWGQGSLGVNRGPVCIAGALMSLAGKRTCGWWRERERFIRLVLEEQYPGFADWPSIEGWKAIEGWNDAPGRTVDEVIAVLEKAAIRRDEAVA